MYRRTVWRFAFFGRTAIRAVVSEVLNMNQRKQPGIVPLTAVIAYRRKNKYGSIAGLPDDELADPEELERQVFIQEFAPVLALAVRDEPTIRPDIDEEGVRCDAFATVDFDRRSARFDKLRFKEERLREELGNVVLLQDPLMRRLPRKPTYLVLKYLRQGVIELDNIDSMDMYLLAKSHLRELRLRREIADLVERRGAHRRKLQAAMFATC